MAERTPKKGPARSGGKGSTSKRTAGPSDEEKRRLREAWEELMNDPFFELVEDDASLILLFPNDSSDGRLRYTRPEKPPAKD